MTKKCLMTLVEIIGHDELGVCRGMDTRKTKHENTSH